MTTPTTASLHRETCECGHVRDEHGGDLEYPNATDCNVDDCRCVAFEASEVDDDNDRWGAPGDGRGAARRG